MRVRGGAAGSCTQRCRVNQCQQTKPLKMPVYRLSLASTSLNDSDLTLATFLHVQPSGRVVCLCGRSAPSLSRSLQALLLRPCQTAVRSCEEEPEPEPWLLTCLLISLSTVGGPSTEQLAWQNEELFLLPSLAVEATEVYLPPVDQYHVFVLISGKKKKYQSTLKSVVFLVFSILLLQHCMWCRVDATSPNPRTSS